MEQKKSILFFILGIFFFLLAGILLPLFLEHIYGASHFMFIPQTAGKYIVAVLWSIILGVVIFISPLNKSDKSLMQALWLLRTFVTLGFMIFYERTYNLDAYNYYKYAVNEEVYSSWFAATGSERVTYLLWLLNKILPTFNSYHAIKVIWSFLGILGGYIFYLGYIIHNPPSKKVLAALCACPSILFWSSIIGKDPIVFLGIGIITYSCLRSLKKFDAVSILSLTVGLCIAGSIRHWLLPIFLLPLLLKVSLSAKKMNSAYWLRTGVLFCTIYFAFGYFIQQTDLTNFQDSFDKINTISRGWAHGGSGQVVPEFRSSKDVLLFMPKAIFAALFRPLPGEINSAFGIMAGFENLVFLGLFIMGLYYFISNYSQLKWSPQFTYYLLTIITWSSFYGLLSYQNLGTAVRFKLQIVPFLIMFSVSVRHHYLTQQINGVK